MSEELQRVEEELARARVAVRRAREYLPQAFTTDGKRRAVVLLAAREARMIGLVAKVLTLRVAARGEGAPPPRAPGQAIAPEPVAPVPAESPNGPRVVWQPPRMNLPRPAEERMRAKLDERVRDLVARSQGVVAEGIVLREHRDPWSRHS